MPDTLHLYADSRRDVERAAELLRKGRLVAFATETVYGLGANALSTEAVAGIFQAKDRPSWDPLIVHVPDASEISRVASLADVGLMRVRALSDAFWPGPMTLLLPRTAAIPDLVTAGRPLVGVRVPAHAGAQSLLRRAGVPIAAPSANRFGHTSPTTAAHVLHDLAGRIDAVLDAGPCAVGVESTVLDPTSTPMVIYRAGAILADALQSATGVPVTTYQVASEAVDPAVRGALPSPGVGVRHYAPEARLVLTAGTASALAEAVRQLTMMQENRIGVMLPAGWEVWDEAPLEVEPWGRWEDPASLATHLFAALRALESRGVGTIVCPLPEAGGLRDALRDRLLKAARPPVDGS